MTIGELEAALDMPRANIRFYEQEGFIHPRRGANNYRDYTGGFLFPADRSRQGGCDG